MKGQVRWLIGIGVAVLAAVALLLMLNSSFGKDPREVPFLLEGKPAPHFAVTDLRTGEPLTSDQLKGQPYVLNFWASWCGPCKVEHPVVDWAARTWGARVRFFGVVFEDTPENARRDLEARGASYPQLLDPESRMAVDFAATGVPETYFIDARGVIVHKFVGPIDPESMRRLLERTLQAHAGGQP